MNLAKNNRRRNPGLAKVDKVIPESIHELGPKVEKLYQMHFVLWHWKDIVGERIAYNVHPVKIERQTLILYSDKATWQNEIRLMQPMIVGKVNSFAGMTLVKDLRFSHYRSEYYGAGSSAVANENGGVESLKTFSRRIKEAPLNDGEIAALKNEVSAVADEELRKKLLSIGLKAKKLERVRREDKWHKCRDCSALCPSDVERCRSCEIRHKEKIRAAIRHYLEDAPWARAGEIKEAVPEATTYLINAERALMVQQLALNVELMDYDSLEAKKLTMLFRQLPPEQLDDAGTVVKNTLYSIRKNLAKPEKFTPIKRYDYLSLGNKGAGKRFQPGKK